MRGLVWFGMDDAIISEKCFGHRCFLGEGSAFGCDMFRRDGKDEDWSDGEQATFGTKQGLKRRICIEKILSGGCVEGLGYFIDL